MRVVSQRTATLDEDDIKKAVAYWMSHDRGFEVTAADVSWEFGEREITVFEELS